MSNYVPVDRHYWVNGKYQTHVNIPYSQIGIAYMAVHQKYFIFTPSIGNFVGVSWVDIPKEFKATLLLMGVSV